MAMNTSSTGGVRSDINITPLVDVVLVMLIIFMVSVPLLQMGYGAQVPPKVESAVPTPNDIHSCHFTGRSTNKNAETINKVTRLCKCTRTSVPAINPTNPNNVLQGSAKRVSRKD